MYIRLIEKILEDFEKSFESKNEVFTEYLESSPTAF